jgi:hypothetical protein
MCNTPTTHRARALLVVSFAFGLFALTAHAARPATTVESAEPAEPARIWVDDASREVVVFALLHSPTFRREFLQAASDPGPQVRLGVAAPPSLRGVGSLGSTRWLERPRAVREASGRVGFRGVIWSRALRGSTHDLAARLGHELAHANELARYGSIVHAPGYRVSVDGRRLAETANGVAVGHQIRIELNNVRFRRPTTAEIEAWLGPSQLRERFPDLVDPGLIAARELAEAEVLGRAPGSRPWRDPEP